MNPRNQTAAQPPPAPSPQTEQPQPPSNQVPKTARNPWVKRVIIAVVVLLVAGAVFAAIKKATPGNKFPAKSRENFLSACETGGGNKNYCQCTLSYLEDHVSYAEFADLDKKAGAGTLKTSADYKVVQDAATSCKAKL